MEHPLVPYTPSARLYWGVLGGMSYWLVPSFLYKAKVQIFKTFKRAKIQGNDPFYSPYSYQM